MKKHKYLPLILGILPIVILIILGYLFPMSIFFNPEQLREYVQSFGIYAPIIFVLLNALQVVITPISWPVVSQAGGYIFGLWYGFFLNWIGRVIGSLIAFFLARKYGKKIVEKFVDKKIMKKFEKMINNGALYVFLVTALPSVLDDELCWLSGLFGMNPWTFFWIAIIGDIPGSFAGAYVGSSLAENNIIPFIANIVLVIIGIVVLSHRKFFNKIVKKNQ